MNDYKIKNILESLKERKDVRAFQIRCKCLLSG